MEGARDIFIEILSIFIDRGIDDAKKINECLVSMIGEDWPTVPLSEWPDRLKARGIEVEEDIAVGVFVNKLIDAWQGVRQ